MKTQKEFQVFVDEIKEVCRKHGVLMVGKPWYDSMFGDIYLFDANEPECWAWDINIQSIGNHAHQQLEGYKDESEFDLSCKPIPGRAWVRGIGEKTLKDFIKNHAVYRQMHHAVINELSSKNCFRSKVAKAVLIYTGIMKYWHVKFS